VTVTHAVGGGNSYTDEQAQDAAAALLTSGSHTGITATYVDASNRVDLAVTGGGGSGGTAAPLNDRGPVAPSTAYSPGDIVAYDGTSKRIVIKNAVTSTSGSFIPSTEYTTLEYMQAVDIRDFGAVMNGSTDDAAAIQAAINSFGTTGNSNTATGGVVFVPAGRTRIGSTLTLPSNVHLIGAGPSASVIQLLPGSNCHMIKTYVSTGGGNSNAFWSSVSNLMLDGRRFQQGVTITDATITAGSTTITSASRNFVNGEYLQGWGLLPGTTVVSGGGTKTAVMSQPATAAAPQNNPAGSQEIYVGGPWHAIYHTTNPYNSIQSGDSQFDPSHKFDNLRIYFINGDGINIAGRSDVHISRCKVSIVAGNGYSVDFDTKISGCISEYAEGSGLEIPGHSSNTIANCKFYNSIGYGVYIHGNTNAYNTLANIDVQQCSLSGLRIDGFSSVNAQNISSAQSGFNQNSKIVAASSPIPGVSLNAVTNCIIDAVVRAGGVGLQLTGSSSGNDIRFTDVSSVSGATRLSSDTITLPGSGNSVVMNGASLTDRLAGLTDVAVSSPSNGQALIYNSTTGKWNNSSAAGGSAPQVVRNLRTTGNLTLGSTTWADVDTALDLVFTASAGDWLEINLQAYVTSEAANRLYFEGFTRVSGADVNGIGIPVAAASANSGPPLWTTPANYMGPVGGPVLYQVQSGDVSSGQVTVRLKYSTDTATPTRAVSASSGGSWPLVFSGRKL
jgi:hypothetical protein